jgi:hypothetical protein
MRGSKPLFVGPSMGRPRLAYARRGRQLAFRIPFQIASLPPQPDAAVPAPDITDWDFKLANSLMVPRQDQCQARLTAGLADAVVDIGMIRPCWS